MVRDNVDEVAEEAASGSVASTQVTEKLPPPTDKSASIATLSSAAACDQLAADEFFTSTIGSTSAAGELAGTAGRAGATGAIRW
ncbi:hypothetical protein GCM10023318_18990 [Nocardia callitridis]|uniref:Uncharacterized protein n=1 Tax=Nocardia callitridis TaxID=648753 RepID=A0ABP9K601_9NOCA